MVLRPLGGAFTSIKAAGDRLLMAQRPISAYMTRGPPKLPQAVQAGSQGSDQQNAHHVPTLAPVAQGLKQSLSGAKRKKPDSGTGSDAKVLGSAASTQPACMEAASTPAVEATAATTAGPMLDTVAQANRYIEACKQTISTYGTGQQALPLQQLLLEPGWAKALAAEMSKPYFATLSTFVHKEYSGNTPIYPPRELVFRAFHACPISQVRVVILGQDPYPNVGQAMGLCFSVNRGITKPQSLNTIFRELQRDCGCPVPSHGDLSSWSTQGVLMLNTLLTVRAKAAASHKGKGWEHFTDAAISAVSRECRGVVFLLWGKPAQAKAKLVDGSKHHVLMAPHPSPLAAASGNVFVGCGHFGRANQLLVQQGKPAIDWCIK